MIRQLPEAGFAGTPVLPLQQTYSPVLSAPLSVPSETVGQVGVYSCPVLALRAEWEVVSRLPSAGRYS